MSDVTQPVTLKWFMDTYMGGEGCPPEMLECVSDLQSELELKNGDTVVTKLTVKGVLSVTRNNKKVFRCKPDNCGEAAKLVKDAYQKIADSITTGATS